MRRRKAAVWICLVWAAAAAAQQLPPQVKNNAYSVAWDGVTFFAPSQNSVYDQIEAIVAGAMSAMLLDVQNKDPNGGAMLYWPLSGGCDDLPTTAFGRSLLDQADELTLAGAMQQDRVYDVRWAGAVLDGTTDDSTAVQTAITAVGAAGGGVVYIPEGDCDIGTTSLVLGANYVWIMGPVRGAAQIQYSGTGAAISVGALGGTARSYCGVQGIQIVKEGTVREAGSIGIAQYSGQSLCVRDVQVSNFEKGIFLDGNGDGGGMGYLVAPRLDNVRFSGCLIQLDIGAPTTAILATGLHFVGPGKTEAGSFGIREESNVGQGNHFSEITIETTETGVQLGGNGQTISGLRCEQLTTGISYLDANVDYCSILGAFSVNCTTDFTAPPAGARGNLLQINGVMYRLTDAATADTTDVWTNGTSPETGLIHTPGTGLKVRAITAGLDLFHLHSTGQVEAAWQLKIADQANWAPLLITARNAAPLSPQTNELYVDDGTNTSSGAPGWRQYDGVAWKDMGALGGEGTGDIESVWTDTAGDVSAMTAGAGDTFDATNADSSVPVPVGAAETVDAEGEMAYDTTDGVLVVYDGSAAKVLADPNLHVSITIPDDGDWLSEAVPIWQAPNDKAVTIKSIRATVIGATTPALAYNIEERAWGSLGSAGTDVYSTDQSADADGEIETTLNNAGIAAGAHLVFTTAASSVETGTVNLIQLTIYYQKDRE